MTITSFQECRRPPLSIREDGSKHGTRTFEILSSDENTTIADILSHASAPAKTSEHPDDSAALLRSFDVEEVDGFDNLHTLTCNYDSQFETNEDDEDNPLDALIRAGFRAQDRPVPAFFDAFGRPNVNTAGDLIEGLVRIANEFVIPVTINLIYVPIELFALNNTLNNATFTMRGIAFPAGTLLLKNMQVPDKPERGNDGTEYWPITFEIIHNPDGFYELHPNRGLHELVYQTRATTGDPFQDATFSAYEAEGTADLKRVIKQPIENEVQQQAATEMWLDQNGQAVTVPVIQTTQIGTGSMTGGGFPTLTADSSVFDADAHVGASIAVIGAGPHGRILRTRIASVSSGTSATLEDAAGTTVASKAIYLPGVICLRIINQPLADWSAIPVPNNDP